MTVGCILRRIHVQERERRDSRESKKNAISSFSNEEEKENNKYPIIMLNLLMKNKKYVSRFNILSGRGIADWVDLNQSFADYIGLL